MGTNGLDISQKLRTKNISIPLHPISLSDLMAYILRVLFLLVPIILLLHFSLLIKLPINNLKQIEIKF